MTQVRLDGWIGKKDKIEVGIDIRFYMRSWLKLNTSITYTFRKYLEEIKEQMIDEMKNEWLRNGNVLTEDVVFFEFKK